MKCRKGQTSLPWRARFWQTAGATPQPTTNAGGRSTLPRLARDRTVVDTLPLRLVQFCLDVSTVFHRLSLNPKALSISGQGFPRRVQDGASSGNAPWQGVDHRDDLCRLTNPIRAASRRVDAAPL